MRTTMLLSTLLTGLAMFGLEGTAAAQSGSPRQYYSSWSQAPGKSYHYRRLYYKPSPSYVGYKHHVVVYHPQKPKHLYFYNPYKKQYWGRCPSESNGRGEYSLLKEADRRENLNDIPESAFPPPGKLPPLPEATDGVPLDLPPDDLPLIPGLKGAEPPSAD